MNTRTKTSYRTALGFRLPAFRLPGLRKQNLKKPFRVKRPAGSAAPLY